MMSKTTSLRIINGNPPNSKISGPPKPHNDALLLSASNKKKKDDFVKNNNNNINDNNFENSSSCFCSTDPAGNIEILQLQLQRLLHLQRERKPLVQENARNVNKMDFVVQNLLLTTEKILVSSDMNNNNNNNNFVQSQQTKTSFLASYHEYFVSQFYRSQNQELDNNNQQQYQDKILSANNNNSNSNPRSSTLLFKNQDEQQNNSNNNSGGRRTPLKERKTNNSMNCSQEEFACNNNNNSNSKNQNLILYHNLRMIYEDRQQSTNFNVNGNDDVFSRFNANILSLMTANQFSLLEKSFHQHDNDPQLQQKLFSSNNNNNNNSLASSSMKQEPLLCPFKLCFDGLLNCLSCSCDDEGGSKNNLLSFAPKAFRILHEGFCVNSDPNAHRLNVNDFTNHKNDVVLARNILENISQEKLQVILNDGVPQIAISQLVSFLKEH